MFSQIGIGQSQTHADADAVMLIKLLVMDEMLPGVQTGDNAFTIW
jgi:hypothetical protein